MANHHLLPLCISLFSVLQPSELDDILNALQNTQPQLFVESRPVSLPSPMDKQNIINDILQMSDNNPSMAPQQQHRCLGPGMGPSSESSFYNKEGGLKVDQKPSNQTFDFCP